MHPRGGPGAWSPQSSRSRGDKSVGCAACAVCVVGGARQHGTRNDTHVQSDACLTQMGLCTAQPMCVCGQGSSCRRLCVYWAHDEAMACPAIEPSRQASGWTYSIDCQLMEKGLECFVLPLLSDTRHHHISSSPPQSARACCGPASTAWHSEALAPRPPPDCA